MHWICECLSHEEWTASLSSVSTCCLSMRLQVWLGRRGLWDSVRVSTDIHLHYARLLLSSGSRALVQRACRATFSGFTLHMEMLFILQDNRHALASTMMRRLGLFRITVPTLYPPIPSSPRLLWCSICECADIGLAC